MALVLVILAAAAAVWWALFARWGSLWVGCAIFLAAGYVLGPPLWSMRLGPVPLTVDRVLLVALGGAFLWQWRAGKLRLGSVTACDWLLVAALAYFTIRCAMTPEAPIGATVVKPWWRLATTFWIPASIYLVARTAPASERSWRAILWTLAGLGGWLALTAFAETTHQWWAVFPRYISDPTLGTHFGRARGPALNSASLGLLLTGCFWAAWFLWPRVARQWKAALAGAMAACAAGVFLTYTRSTWIGLAGTVAFIPLLQLPRRWRLPALGCIAATGLAALLIMGGMVARLSRQDADGSAEHSAYQRASFALVSMRMFRDAPLFGCGFGRFYDLKQPYLADRSQQLELESLRLLDHHNTFLSVLTETGIVGCLIFVGVIAAFARTAWRLAHDENCDTWQRAHGLWALAAILAYVASAAFHDLTLSPYEHWLLFLTAGISVGLVAKRQTTVSAEPASPRALSSLRPAWDPRWAAPPGY